MGTLFARRVDRKKGGSLHSFLREIGVLSNLHLSCAAARAIARASPGFSGFSLTDLVESGHGEIRAIVRVAKGGKP